MKLSEISTRPIYSVILPSSGKPIKYTPFSVKDERALLTAHESDDSTTIINTLAAVIKNSIVEKSAITLTVFDLEFLFMHIRAKSVGEISTLSFTCTSCAEKTIVSFDITKTVVSDISRDRIITLNGDLSIKMKYVSIDDLLEIEGSSDINTILPKTVAASIESIIKGDEVILVSEEPINEIINFIDDLSSKEFKKLSDFIEKSPTISLTVPWKCVSCGTEHSSKLSGINDFF